MFGRVNDIDAASQHGERLAMSVEGPLMRFAVDSSRQTADDGEALGRQLEAEPLRHPASDIAGGARADYRDTGAVGQSGSAADEQERRRVGDLPQIRWIVGVGPFDESRAEVGQLAQFFLERLELAKFRNAVRGVARHSGRGDLVGVELEYFFGRAELVDQQLAGSRTDSAGASQCEPINVW